MAFDGNFVHALLGELEVLKRGKINRIQQIDETSMVFKVRSAGSNHNLLGSARIPCMHAST